MPADHSIETVLVCHFVTSFQHGQLLIKPGAMTFAVRWSASAPPGITPD